MIPQGSQKVAGVSEPRSGIDHRNLDRGAPTPAGVAQRGATPAGVGSKFVVVSGGFRMMRSYIFVSTPTVLRRFNSIEFDVIKNGSKELFALVAIADKCGGMIKQLQKPGAAP